MNTGIEGNSYGAIISHTRITYKVGQGSSQIIRDAVLIGTNDDELNYGSTQTATDLILQMPSMYNSGAYLGAGSLSLQIPDGTLKGGNTRGISAIDLQIRRDSATQVASGNHSVVMGGSNTATASCAIAMGYACNALGSQSVALGYINTASNFYSVAMGSSNNSSGSASIAMGYNNISSGSSSVAIGGSNTASIDYSVAMGNNNTASGQGGFALGGKNVASGLYSFAIGQYATTNNIRGKFVFGNNYNSSIVGAVQSGFINVYAGTIDATATILSSDGNTANYTNQCVLQNNNAMAFTVEVVARNTVTGMAGRWEAKGLIKRGANASATALVGTPTVTLTNADNEAWIVAGAITITADTINGSLAIKATGAASTTIDWAAKILTTEVV